MRRFWAEMAPPLESPLPHLRRTLEQSRQAGADLGDVWEDAIRDALRSVGAVPDGRSWQDWLVALEETRGEWESAYERRERGRQVFRLLDLIAQVEPDAYQPPAGLRRHAKLVA